MQKAASLFVWNNLVRYKTERRVKQGWMGKGAWNPEKEKMLFLMCINCTRFLTSMLYHQKLQIC